MTANPGLLHHTTREVTARYPHDTTLVIPAGAVCVLDRVSAWDGPTRVVQFPDVALRRYAYEWVRVPADAIQPLYPHKLDWMLNWQTKRAAGEVEPNWTEVGLS